MIYQPMTDNEAEDLYVDVFVAYVATFDDTQAADLYAFMQHLKQDYGVIPALRDAV